MLVGAGSAGSSVDAANLLKPALARGELQCIGATTLDEYRKYIEGDAALERRFQPVLVDEPTIEQTIEILKGVRKMYEAHHQLKISDEALNAAARLVGPLRARPLPARQGHRPDGRGVQPGAHVQGAVCDDAARDIPRAEDARRRPRKRPSKPSATTTRSTCAITRSSSRSKLEQLRKGWQDAAPQPIVTEDDIAEVVGMWTGIPMTRLVGEETARLLEMEDYLHKRVVGQDEPVKAIARAVRRARTGLKDPKRPIGTFMFLGPTGVGKTLLAKSLAEFLFGSEEALIKLDMSEFMERHNVSRLVGAPPGYVGYEEGGQLSEAVRRRPYSVVLLDEIEKAHPEVFNMLLQIMEDGSLADAKGRRIDFRNAILIMTSNVGANLIKHGGALGFATSRDDAARQEDEYQVMRDRVTEALKRTFRPEFLNRLDGTMVFRSLTKDQISEIVAWSCTGSTSSWPSRRSRWRSPTRSRTYLADEGYDAEYGARPLRRVIQDKLEDRLSEALLTGEVKPGSKVRITLGENKELFDVEHAVTIAPPPPTVAEATEELVN